MKFSVLPTSPLAPGSGVIELRHAMQTMTVKHMECPASGGCGKSLVKLKFSNLFQIRKIY